MAAASDRSRSPSLGVRAQSPSPPPQAAGPAAAAVAATDGGGADAVELAWRSLDAAAYDVVEAQIGGAGMEELGVAAAYGMMSRRLYEAAEAATSFISEQEGRSFIADLEDAEAASTRFHTAAAAAAAHTAIEGMNAARAGASPDEAEAARGALVRAKGAGLADELEAAAQGQLPEMQATARQLIELLPGQCQVISEAAASAADGGAGEPGGGAGPPDGGAGEPSGGGVILEVPGGPVQDGQPILDIVISGSTVIVADRGALVPTARMRMTQDPDSGPHDPADGPIVVHVVHRDGRVTELPSSSSGAATLPAAPRPRGPRVVRVCGTCGQAVDSDHASYQDLWSNRGRRGHEYAG